MATVTQIGPRLGIAPTCAALGLPRATYYRRRRPRARRAAAAAVAAGPRRGGARGGARRCCTSRASSTWPRREVYATLLDEGRYLCSERTMYRILAAQRTRCASGATSSAIPSTPPPSCWPAGPTSSGAGTSPSCSGPAKWTYFYLYVILDVFSRYVVGWMVAHRESATLAEQLIRETCARQGIAPRAAHPPRRSRLVDDLQARRPAARRSRRHQDALAGPHVSNDNPFSEAQFKTLKYRPGASRSASARSRTPARFCHDFFPWYNTEHHHSGLGLLTPARRALRPGRAARRRARRRARRGLRGPSRAVSRGPSGPGGDAHRGLDQSPQAQRARGGGAHSLNSRPGCLILVDRLRQRHCAHPPSAVATSSTGCSRFDSSNGMGSDYN